MNWKIVKHKVNATSSKISQMYYRSVTSRSQLNTIQEETNYGQRLGKKLYPMRFESSN